MNKEIMQRIYSRILELLKKIETKNYNSATFPAFQIGFEADLKDLIKSSRSKQEENK